MPQLESAEEIARAEAAERAQERVRELEAQMRTFVAAVEFEVGCMEHYGAEKHGMLGKLAREMAEPLRVALDSLAAGEGCSTGEGEARTEYRVCVDQPGGTVELPGESLHSCRARIAALLARQSEIRDAWVESRTTTYGPWIRLPASVGEDGETDDE